MSNVIEFPSSKEETIKIKNRMAVEEESEHFSLEVMEVIHDLMHDRTGECIFTDEEYRPIRIFLSEVISAMYLKSQGHDDHPMIEISNEIFGDDQLDIADYVGYTGENQNNEEP
jgi:hypothetical protein